MLQPLQECCSGLRAVDQREQGSRRLAAGVHKEALTAPEHVLQLLEEC